MNAPSVHTAEQEVAHADERRKEANDVALAGVLAALASHEVLADDDAAKLVALEFEPRHIVENGEDEAARADKEDGDGDTEPDPLVHEEWVNRLDEVHQEAENDGRNDVLHRDCGEGVFDLDVCAQMVVDEVDLLLSIVDLAAADVPLLLVGEKVLDRGVALEVHCADRQVRHGSDVVVREDFLDVTVGAEVNDAEEHVLLAGKILVQATLLHE